MKTMAAQRVRYTCLFFLFCILIGWKEMNISYWIIASDSSLEVQGKTNVSKYSCAILHYDHTDTLQLIRGTSGGIGLCGSMNLSIERFDCHNAMMTNELRKTLRSTEFPVLHIQFLSLSALPVLGIRPLPVSGIVDIKLAGCLKRYNVNYQISKDLKGMIHLVGTRDVSFSDFQLTPPKKLGGLVRSEDKITVVFNLNIRNQE
jgi:hypothetical protein